MNFKVGDAVEATMELRANEDGDVFAKGEPGFETATIEYCVPGDVGEVLFLATDPDELPITVLWIRTNTITGIVDDECIALIRSYPERNPDDAEQTGRWVWAQCNPCHGKGGLLEQYEDGTDKVVVCMNCRGQDKVLVKL